MKKLVLLISTTLVFSGSCGAGPSTDTDNSFLLGFDFDGDRINDEIEYVFSGGAHCCYRISVYLSSNKTWYRYPFELDGGYPVGLDNSIPNQFCIKDFDNDGLPEIFMEISTYNGEKSAIPDEWHEKFGISTNWILIEYENAELKVKDFKKIE